MTNRVLRFFSAKGEVGKLISRLAAFDERHAWVVVSLGGIAGALVASSLLGWASVTYLLATGLLGLAWWQGRRAEARLIGEGVPETVKEPSPGPEPPYVVEDPDINMVVLPAGSFWMGSDPDSDPSSGENERPRHRVTLSAFAMAEAPVTRELYQVVMGQATREWDQGKEAGRGEEDWPATWVSWGEAVRFCNALSERSGLGRCYRRRFWIWTCDRSAEGYRLPTEAEWEYACRAGTQTPWFWGESEGQAGRYAWYSANANDHPRAVKSREPNPWGLYDMSGNVWEWCEDRYGRYGDQEQIDPVRTPIDRRRVLRGGSFVDVPRGLRSADRRGREPVDWYVSTGFRCVRGSGRL